MRNLPTAAAQSDEASRHRRCSIWLGSVAALLVVFLASCTATQPATTPNGDTPGFWLGLWHGFIAPITFIVSLFTESLRIYAFPNAGRWYDFGFMLGISGFSGGIFAGSRRRD